MIKHFKSEAQINDSQVEKKKSGFQGIRDERLKPVSLDSLDKRLKAIESLLGLEK